ncbi:MAG: four helix bundle protein [Bacteroidota bacterium]
MKNFKQLKIWQTGMQLVSKVYDLAKQLPKEEKYGLISQMTRSAVSIPSNIAERSSRRSERDYYRFIEIAHGSSFELETQLLIAKEVFPDGSKLAEEALELLTEEQKMLTSFLKKLNN